MSRMLAERSLTCGRCILASVFLLIVFLTVFIQQFRTIFKANLQRSIQYKDIRPGTIPELPDIGGEASSKVFDPYAVFSTISIELQEVGLHGDCLVISTAAADDNVEWMLPFLYKNAPPNRKTCYRFHILVYCKPNLNRSEFRHCNISIQHDVGRECLGIVHAFGNVGIREHMGDVILSIPASAQRHPDRLKQVQKLLARLGQDLLSLPAYVSEAPQRTVSEDGTFKVDSWRYNSHLGFASPRGLEKWLCLHWPSACHVAKLSAWNTEWSRGIFMVRASRINDLPTFEFNQQAFGYSLQHGQPEACHYLERSWQWIFSEFSQAPSRKNIVPKIRSTRHRDKRASLYLGALRHVASGKCMTYISDSVGSTSIIGTPVVLAACEDDMAKNTQWEISSEGILHIAQNHSLCVCHQEAPVATTKTTILLQNMVQSGSILQLCHCASDGVIHVGMNSEADVVWKSDEEACLQPARYKSDALTAADMECYLERYSDLHNIVASNPNDTASKHASLLAHYVEYGRRDFRDPTCSGIQPLTFRQDITCREKGRGELFPSSYLEHAVACFEAMANSELHGNNDEPSLGCDTMTVHRRWGHWTNYSGLHTSAYLSYRAKGSFGHFVDKAEEAFRLERVQTNKRHRQQNVPLINSLKERWNERVLFGHIDPWSLVEKLALTTDRTDIMLRTTSQYIHCLQVFEGMVLDGISERKLLFLALWHDIGKLLSLFGEEDSNVDGLNDIVVPGRLGAGMQSVVTNWNHDEFGYHKLNRYVSPELAWVIRYHSCIPLISGKLDPILTSEERAWLPTLHTLWEYDHKTKSYWRAPELDVDLLRELTYSFLPRLIEF